MNDKMVKNIDKKQKIYFETIVCLALGIAVLSIAICHTIYYNSLPREVQLAPGIVVMIDYLIVDWMYYLVAAALFTIAVVRVQRYKVKE